MEKLNITGVIPTWRERISKAGKTQEQAAKESGLHKSQLSQYICGKNIPSISKFEQFENYLRGLGV